MRKLLQIILVFQVMVAAGQVGVHTDFPDNSSAMDIVAANRGLLIPRVTLTSNLSNPSPVTAPAIGLLVFNSGANQAIGFYYWSGSAWTLIGGSGGGGGNDWTLTGNAGTIPGTNFIGTTDNQHFLVKTNNAERMRFESDGQIIIGGTVPQAATHVFTVYGNTTQNFAFAAFSPTVGFYNLGGRYGVFSQVDTACTPNPGFAVWAKNTDLSSYGIYAVGSNVTSLPLITSHTAGITSYGYDGLHAWGRNATNGQGICAIGSGQNSSFALTGVSAGVSAIGNYGIISRGTTTSGRGIVAIGSGFSTPSTSLESEGGAFTGFHGIYAKGTGYQATPTEIAGIGVIGVGYNQSSYSALADGLSSGGAFSGDYGVYAKGLLADGVGVVGVGSAGSGYYTLTNGSGGSFAGYHGLLSVGINVAAGMGVVGAGNNSAYSILPSGGGGVFTAINTGAAGFATNPTGGIGIIGAGNNQAAWLPTSGGGGAFTGNIGVLATSVLANGTGIIGLGNAITSPGTFADGAGGSFIGTLTGAVARAITVSNGTGIVAAGNNVTAKTYTSGGGGAFTGTAAGLVAWGTTAATGIGVIAAGNNATPTTPSANGCGGAFTGTVCGAYGYATNTSNDRYGGYFATGGNLYAYVGGRYSSTNRKIVGSGSVSTIVNNREGNRITLTCPEAPESVFQDFGIGQLVEGRAHITIDPDLAININVSEGHPLKVYITPEGDCKGVYVTNKSANGFDVIELQGGTSTIPFAWQIVAIRANEEYTLKDGTVEISDYSQRFPPAPPPMELIEQPAQSNQMTILETKPLEKVTISKDHFIQDQTMQTKTLEVKEDQVIELKDDDVK